VLAGDVDISDEQLRNTYQSELVNGLGNLCSRVAKMAESINLTGQNSDADWDKNYCDFLDNFQTHKALEVVRGWVNETDKYLSDKKPWAVENENEKAEILNQAIISILRIAKHLVIYMPNTSEQITKHFSSEKITALTPMFPRVS
jgi:methionyl-tRNA synthetase